MPDKDDLDLLLDSALATYADPGPDSGLEQRLLIALAGARTAAESRNPSTKPRRWLVWAIAVPVAASLLFWLSTTKFNAPSTRRQQASQGRPSISSHDSHASSNAAPPAVEVLKGHRTGPVLKGHDFSRAVNAAHSRGASAPAGRLSANAELENRPLLPKLDVFPTPQPLTPQERGLAAVAVQAPAPLRQALATAQEQDNAPIRIAEIHIPPIQPPAETHP